MTSAGGTTADRRLAALGAHLSAHGLTVELTSRGLRVKNPEVRGCCPENPTLSDLIGCRARADDGGRLWFFTGWAEPIAPADQVTEAVVTIKGYLSDRRGTVMASAGAR
jgi:hypothetical protein